jgi:LCP family protein required for cell wall assembly
MKDIKKIKFAIYILSIMFIAFSVTFAFSIKQKSNLIHEKDLMINVLIDEVGQLKEQTDNKFELLQNVNGKLNHLLLQIDGLKEEIGKEITNNENNLENIKKNLSKTEKEFSSLLQEKDKLIMALINENKTISTNQQKNPILQHNKNLHTILLLGEHAGLMDTIILAVANDANKKISLISIPRDLYINGRKINALYSKYGTVKLKETLSDMTGLTIDKYALWSFDSFIKIIDELGGIEINIEKTIIDNAYPSGNGYTTVKFNQGLQTLNGEQALKYVRSRKSTSDFDRSRRQHEVIQATIDKAKSLNLITKVDVALNTYAKIKPHLKTDIDFFEALSKFTKYKDYTITRLVISNQNYLKSGTNNGQYILSPRDSTYSEIWNAINQLVH